RAVLAGGFDRPASTFALSGSLHSFARSLHGARSARPERRDQSEGNAMSSEGLHAPREVLSQEARLLHYAITSLKEELDAVDWYRQRADDTEDEALREILLHNMREEMEHAAMVLEWIRRRNGDFAGHLKTYLFTDKPIV